MPHREYSMIVGTPTPAYPNAYGPELLHWDGAFFCLLCLVSWLVFLWLWAWNHRPKPEQRPPPLKVEKFVRSNYWRN